MYSDRFKEVERLYFAALELDASMRPAFLNSACGGDDSLRQEVESLLKHDDERFLNTPAWAQAMPRLPELDANEAPTADIHLNVGKVICQYRIIAPLATGGMGVVYKAEDTQLHRFVALKFLPKTSVNTKGLLRFRREARAASALNHPNICTIYELGQNDDEFFIAMEFLDGRTLKDEILRKPFGIQDVLRLSIEIVDGLDAAHVAGIIHRDLKPSNIFVTARGHVKLLDFGLAQRTPNARFDPGLTSETLTIERLTIPGTVIGTVAYMSPEQARGEVLDPRSDLFSCGAVLYEIVTACPAFPGTNMALIFDAILRQVPMRPLQRCPSLPPELDRIIMKALEKDRTMRYQSAADMRSDLERLNRDMTLSNSGKHAPVQRRWPRIALTGILLALSFVPTIYFSWYRSKMLTLRDTVLLADFANSTGEGVFDGALRQGLSAQLEQSPFLNLLSDQRIAQTLVLMTQQKDAKLTHELAIDVCQRTGSTATIEGSIAALGTQYVLGLRAVECITGDLLAEEQVTANGKEQVLRALGVAAKSIRTKLGESLSSVEKYDVAPESVTTPSLEALRAYGLGCRAQNMLGDYGRAILQYQRAIGIDPNFAMAYARLGTSYASTGESTRALQNIRKAYELRNRVSERERFYITAHYEETVTGDVAAAEKVYEVWSQAYPRDYSPLSNLVNIYAKLGQYDKALGAAKNALDLNPGSRSYANLAGIYLYLNRLRDASTTIADAKARHFDAPPFHLILYMVGFLQDDRLAMAKEAAVLSDEHTMLYFQSDSYAYVGQFARAWELSQRAAELAKRADETESAACYRAEAALRSAMVGDIGLAAEQAHVAVAFSPSMDVEAIAALSLSLAGDQIGAIKVADDLATRFPRDTIVQLEYIPLIRACINLSSGKDFNPGRALQTLASTRTYELGLMTGVSNVALCPLYFRGQAYLAAQQGREAAGEFQNILDHPGIAQNFLVRALARLGLGRAYALDGELAKARVAYGDFLHLWQHADPDIPLFKAAQTEYKHLLR